jgi:Homeodomain-like domain
MTGEPHKTALRLRSITVCGPGRYEVTFQRGEETRTFACRVASTESGAVVPVWETRFHEVMGGRHAGIAYELTWLVSYLHLAQQTEWSCPPRRMPQRPVRSGGRTSGGRRPIYGPEVRASAMAAVLEGGQTLKEAAADIGCSDRQIRRWLRRAELEAGCE